MIVPSGRAVTLAALGAVPALVVALAVPAYWYAGLIVVLFVVGLTVADAFATVPTARLALELDVPRATMLGERVAARVSTGIGRAVELLLEHDARLQPIARKTREGQIDLDTLRRGTAKLAALWVRWSGPFGLVWRQQRVPLDRNIAILPDIRPVRAAALQLYRRDAQIGDIAQFATGTGGEFQSLADFRTGMDRRAIDWKASARHGNLIAKEYRTERNNDLVFAVDCGRLMCEPVDGIARLDRALTAALTAAFVALKGGDKVSLFGFDSRPRISSGAVSGLQSFAMFQALAAELDYSTEETNFTLALTTLGTQLKRRSLVVVFTDFADPTSAELMLRNIGRLAERHLVLFVVMRDAELESLADGEPLTAADVSRAVIAAAMLRERRIVMMRLRRLGVEIVETPSDRMGPDLVTAYLALKRRNVL